LTAAKSSPLRRVCSRMWRLGKCLSDRATRNGRPPGGNQIARDDRARSKCTANQ
jgi:hypothetical protein